MAYRRVRSYGNTMGATSGTETANSSREPEYTPGCLLPVVISCVKKAQYFSGMMNVNRL
jgi:hypothetical protein